jgi:hypothetical protein
MLVSKEQTECSAFFTSQMLIHVIRGLVLSGIYAEATAITNIRETMDRCTEVLGEEHHPALVALAHVFEQSVREAAAAYRAGKTRIG